MLTPWNELTRDEQSEVKMLYRGHHPLLTVKMAKRLKELGWAEEKLGGTGISREGKDAYGRMVLAARRRNEDR